MYINTSTAFLASTINENSYNEYVLHSRKYAAEELTAKRLADLSYQLIVSWELSSA